MLLIQIDDSLPDSYRPWGQVHHLSFESGVSWLENIKQDDGPRGLDLDTPDLRPAGWWYFRTRIEKGWFSVIWCSPRTHQHVKTTWTVSSLKIFPTIPTDGALSSSSPNQSRAAFEGPKATSEECLDGSGWMTLWRNCHSQQNWCSVHKSWLYRPLMNDGSWRCAVWGIGDDGCLSLECYTLKFLQILWIMETYSKLWRSRNALSLRNIIPFTCWQSRNTFPKFVP